MRRFPAIIAPFALLAPLLTLAACGEGSALDEQVQASVRSSLIASCAVTAQGQVPEGVNVDLNKVCDCAVDKLMAGKSLKELAANPPTSAEDLAPIKACLKEAGPVTMAPAPE